MDYKEKAKAKRYDEAIERARKLKKDPQSVFNEYSPKEGDTISDYIFPELKESEDERVRKNLIGYIKGISKNEVCEETKNSWIAWLEKQGEQKPDDKTEPKFKVKYAGSEYNVFETKDIAGVTFYGIEDEPNHIDYVQAENCERVSGYSIKENGSPYPTKPAVFSDQKSIWSEEDEIMIKVLDSIIRYIVEIVDKDALERFGTNREELLSWLKSLRPQNKWKPSDEQMEALANALSLAKSCGEESAFDLRTLYEQLKKLKRE